MKKQQITFAAGCFWGVEHLFKELNGVLNTTVGYTGGASENPTYKQVCTGTTGHSEAVLVEYDDSLISTQELIDAFFRLHDPTTLNRQHNDVGTQYRSALYYFDEEQKKLAEKYVQQLEADKVFSRPIVTEIQAATVFYPAEEEHQDYLDKNPGGYMCHVWRSK